MKNIIEKAREFALKEISNNIYPLMCHFDISNKKGQELAEKLNVDKDIVMLGTILMDIKLGECFKEKKPQEHIERGIKATTEFLNQFEIEEDIKNKIIACVKEHHGTNEYYCKESEICANADCYRFASINGCLRFINEDSTFDDFNELIKFAGSKADEKWNIVSIESCKEELEEDYKIITKIVERLK
jgi:hypothetical protein